MIYSRFHFGKYRGECVSSAPSSYLRWCLDTIQDLSPWFRADIVKVLRQRGDHPETEEEDDPPSPPAVDWRPVVKTWFGQLSRRYHPDQGGTDEQMRVVNNARELLEELLRQQVA